MSWDDNDSSSDSNFVFMGDSSGSAGVVGWLLVIVAMGLLIWWLNSRHKEQDQKLLTYINAHNCFITGYMGGDKKKRAIYQCDTGQKLDFEVREAALK
jgi:hypothetical protein